MTNQLSGTKVGTRDATSVTTRVLEAVAERAGVDVVDLPPLYDAVDPDALERLFAPTTADGPSVGRVAFAYDGYEVTVERDGDDAVAVAVADRAVARCA